MSFQFKYDESYSVRFVGDDKPVRLRFKGEASSVFVPGFDKWLNFETESKMIYLVNPAQVKFFSIEAEKLLTEPAE